MASGLLRPGPVLGEILAVLSVSSAPIVVDGAGDCPAASQLEVELERVLPAGAAGHAPDRASVEQLGDKIRITLTDDRGETRGERDFSAALPCADLAAAAALALATWVGDFHPEFAPTAVSRAPVVVARLSPPPPLGVLDVGLGMSAGLADTTAAGAVLARPSHNRQV